MSAAYVPMEIDQGEDWTTTIVYTDEMDQPYNIVPPCRMDIKNTTGAIQLSLTTPDDLTAVPDGEIPEITLSSDVGLVQIHIEDAVTSALLPGVYKYDLFVTINDGNEYSGNQIQRLIRGEVVVNQRVTVL